MMTDLLAARSQMAMSLGFHIIFAAIGIAMPLMMALAEWRWMRTGEQVYLTLAKRWSKGTAILFAVGAVSGTVLSFELGLLWPAFMNWAGPIIGPLFAFEGFAFFTEAIFLGIYLHGWSHLRPRMHLAAGVIVVISGVASAIVVVIANAWMNTPIGFDLVEGHAVHIDPIAAMQNPHAAGEVVHMILAAFAATGFAVAGIHAYLLLRQPGNVFHRHALQIALIVGALPAVVQPLSGDLLTKSVAQYQPAKLAAFEAHFHTERGAAFHLGGLPDLERQEVPYAIDIPYGLSLLLYLDPTAQVIGLDAFPRTDWPPITAVHVAFQFMVGVGLVMMALALWAGWCWWRKRPLEKEHALLRALALTAPLGFLAIESGWVVTEVGRQPWIIYGVMRTSEAVTPMPGLWVPMVTFTVLYGILAAIVVWLLRRHIAATESAQVH